MRIAFLGKGGSGKTTISSAFISYIAKNRKHVVAVDADINVHLQKALQISGKPNYLSQNYKEIASYLEGDRSDFKNVGLTIPPAFGSIPPSSESTFILPHAEDPFIKRFALKKGTVSLLTVGTFDSQDVGSSCYHGKLNSLEIFFHHLLDTKEDIIVADTTAGIDNLGTSLFMVYDVNIFVIEPTKKSISVYLEFKKLLSKLHHNITLFALVNKVIDDEDRNFVHQYISNEEIIGFVSISPNVKESEQGKREAFDHFVVENEFLFRDILSRTARQERDWGKYFRILLKIYQKECRKEWNAYYNAPLDTIYEQTFQYERFLQKEERV